MICSRDYISPLVFISQEEIPPAVICSRNYISPLVFISQEQIPPAVICNGDYISSLVIIHLPNGFMHPAVKVGRYYTSPLVFTPSLQGRISYAVIEGQHINVGRYASSIGVYTTCGHM